MGIFILDAWLQAIPVVFLSSVGVFLLLHLLPGDPALVLAGPDAPPATIEAIRQDMGLDRAAGRAVRGLARARRARRPRQVARSARSRLAADRPARAGHAGAGARRRDPDRAHRAAAGRHRRPSTSAAAADWGISSSSAWAWPSPTSGWASCSSSCSPSCSAGCHPAGAATSARDPADRAEVPDPAGVSRWRCRRR